MDSTKMRATRLVTYELRPAKRGDQCYCSGPVVLMLIVPGKQ